MDKKTYKKYKFCIVLLLGVIIGFSNSLKSSLWSIFIPLIAMIVAMIVLWYLQKQLDSIINDERVEYIGGKAAAYTINIVVIISAFLSIFFLGIKKYELIGYTISSTMFLILFIYSILYYYFDKKGKQK